MTYLNTITGSITHAEYKRREAEREARNTRLIDLECIKTDLEAAFNTAEGLEDDEDIASEIDALAAKVRARIGLVECGG